MLQLVYMRYEIWDMSRGAKLGKIQGGGVTEVTNKHGQYWYHYLGQFLKSSLFSISTQSD